MINNFAKVILAGFLASLVMFVLLYLGIYILGIMPFNISPSAAFLYNLGIDNDAYAILLHFAYGILWSYVLVFTFEDDVSIRKAVVLSVILWAFMMVVYSPLIGWGMFGYGYAHNLPAHHPLYLESGLTYVIATLIAHLIYGWVLGYLNCRWLRD